jgi:uncharacterized delta-60 repeat protein
MKRLEAALLAGFIAGWLLPTPVRAADGDLDPTFGTGGKVVTGFEVPAAFATSVAIQPDGKIVVAGFLFDETANLDFALARYDPDGSLDETFDFDGRLRTDFFGLDDLANAIALQPDGKIVVAGTARVGFDLSIALARYNADGILDTTFDLDGKAVVAGFTGTAYGVLIQPDGKILVAGSHFSLVRFNADGSLDAAFGKNGKVAVDGFTANALVLQPDGKVIVAGFTNRATGTHDDFAVARFNNDGSPDQAFGSDGIAVTDFFGGGDIAWAVTLQSDGRIVAGGYAAVRFAIARYNADGSLDATFDGDGRKTTDLPGFDEVVFGVAVQSDGKILAGGHAFGAGFYDFALVRYTANGAEDPSFGASGLVTTDFFGRSDGIRGIALRPEGEIIAAGGAQDVTTGYFALARYRTSSSVPGGCPNSAGFWKAHRELWPVTSLTLGSQVYSSEELLRILSRPVRGDASILLAGELIAGKLNIANGAGLDTILADVAAADALLAGYPGKLPYDVSPASAQGRAMVRLAGRLASQNNRRSDPGCSSAGDSARGR